MIIEAGYVTEKENGSSSEKHRQVKARAYPSDNHQFPAQTLLVTVTKLIPMSVIVGAMTNGPRKRSSRVAAPLIPINIWAIEAVASVPLIYKKAPLLIYRGLNLSSLPTFRQSGVMLRMQAETMNLLLWT